MGAISDTACIPRPLEEEGGEEKTKVVFERIFRISRWMGLKLGAQLDLFAPKQSAADQHFSGHASQTSSRSPWSSRRCWTSGNLGWRRHLLACAPEKKDAAIGDARISQEQAESPLLA
jgi:hypothetical protein